MKLPTKAAFWESWYRMRIGGVEEALAKQLHNRESDLKTLADAYETLLSAKERPFDVPLEKLRRAPQDVQTMKDLVAREDAVITQLRKRREKLLAKQ